MDQSVIEKCCLQIAGITGKVDGAFNLRENGQGRRALFDRECQNCSQD